MALRVVKRLRAARAMNEFLSSGSASELRAVLAEHPELLTEEATKLLEDAVQQWKAKEQPGVARRWLRAARCSRAAVATARSAR